MSVDQIALFDDLAQLQREAPESAMLAVRRFYGNGLLPTDLEETGDLINRMTDARSYEYGGYPYVLNKVKLMLSRIRRPDWMMRYPLDVEQQTKMVSDVKGIPLQAFKQKLDALLARYVSAHLALPTYNSAQRLAQQAAVAIGRRDYDGWEKALTELNKHLGSKDEWVEFAHRCDGCAQPRTGAIMRSFRFAADRIRLPKGAQVSVCAYPRQLAQAARNPKVRDIHLYCPFNGGDGREFPYPKTLFIREFGKLSDIPMVVVFEDDGSWLRVVGGNPDDSSYDIDWTGEYQVEERYTSSDRTFQLRDD